MIGAGEQPGRERPHQRTPDPDPRVGSGVAHVPAAGDANSAETGGENRDESVRGLPAASDHISVGNAVDIIPTLSMTSKLAFPSWWSWELSFTSHAELRMEQRGVTEVDVRAMLEQATAFEPSVVEGRFMIHVARNNRPWIVIVEPDNDASLLVVVTVYEVSE
jgi:Domain of unknown function (DUF4258)